MNYIKSRLAGWLACLALIASIAAFAQAAEQGTIRGKVESDGGKAVANAEVTATREGAEPVNTKTNSKGEFTLQLEPGEYSLAVDAQGFKSAQLLRKQKVEAGKTTKLSGTIVLEESRAITVIRGAVFNERGFSLPGASVQIERMSGEKFRKDYTTNSAGEFAFRLPESGGQFKLTASARGFESASQTVEIAAGEARNVAFSLKPASK